MNDMKKRTCKHDWWKDKALEVALEQLKGFVAKSYKKAKSDHAGIANACAPSEGRNVIGEGTGPANAHEA